MEKKIVDGLKSIVGEKNISFSAEAAKMFLHSRQEASNLGVVSPSDDNEVQKIVDLARENNKAIITVNDRCLLEEDVDKKGILLEFSRMNKIERIDTKNLVAHVQRGVTWEQLNAELKRLGVKAIAPVAAHSESVAECCAGRVVGKAASKFWDYPITNLRLVLANGHIHRTGTHGFLEETYNARHEGGPNLSNWFYGSDDIFGIMTRASIMVWPVYEGRTCLVYSFEDSGELLKTLQELPRTELGVEYLGINSAFLKNVLCDHKKDYPPWILAVGFEGRSKHVAHNRDRVYKLLKKYRGKEEKNLVDTMTEQLDQPWMEAGFNHTSFFTLFSKLKNMDAEVDRAADAKRVPKDKVGKIYTSYDHGRAVYAVYDWLDEQYQPEAIKALNLSLVDQGAFFSRPHGNLGRKIYTSIPHHLPVLKYIKEILDPGNIMNPGRIIKDEDAKWQPPEVGNGEAGLTVSNIETVKEKLSEALGNDWVSDNPVDLSAYGHDCTIFSGKCPNIVVMPQATEEVQKIFRIAYEHGIPLVPQTTGFNQDGSAIPRRGGIQIDLRRMNTLCSIDEESMTATVNPGVRIRSLWWESIKHKAVDGFHLKPLLPMSFSSVSLLSNYLTRGASGMAPKYGVSSDLTTGMTWVLPNGEVLKVGPSAIPKVGNLPLHYTPGPDLFGMFFNADGIFGICTELTAKLYPENDNVDEVERLVCCISFDQDSHDVFCRTVDASQELVHEQIVDFIFKTHHGPMALQMINNAGGKTVPGMMEMIPQHPLTVVVSGYDEEESEIKKDLVNGIVQKHQLLVIDPSMFGPEMADAVSTDIIKKSQGIKNNFMGAYQGTFQHVAFVIGLEKIPRFELDYKILVRKHWKTSDPSMPVEHVMTGINFSPYSPLGRNPAMIVDFWWDQGNPEDVKRASTMMRKTQELILKHGGLITRNYFGVGEYQLPLWGKNSEYFVILKEARKGFDPAYLMHPEVLSLSDDCV